MNIVQTATDPFGRPANVTADNARAAIFDDAQTRSVWPSRARSEGAFLDTFEHLLLDVALRLFRDDPR